MEDHVAKLAHELRRDMSSELQGLVENLTKLAAARGDVNPIAQITVSAGGAGIWLSAMCAGLCFVMVLVLLMLYVDQSRKIDDLNHYLQAIYAQAPQLKPEDK